MLTYLNTVPRQLAPRRLALRRFPLEMLIAVFDEDTDKLMEYRKLIWKQNNQQLYRKSYAKEIGHLVQGIPALVECTKNIFYRKEKYPRLEVERHHIWESSGELFLRKEQSLMHKTRRRG